MCIRDSYTFDAENVQPQHPIMKGFGKSFTAPKGELYHSMKVFPTATTLASAKRRDNGKAQTCVWVNEYKPTVGVNPNPKRKRGADEAASASGDSPRSRVGLGSDASGQAEGCRVFGTTIGHYNETMVEPQ